MLYSLISLSWDGRFFSLDSYFHLPLTDEGHNFSTVVLGSTQTSHAGLAGELKQMGFNSNTSVKIRFHYSQISWSHSFSRALCR